jgi:hypothetical protein
LWPFKRKASLFAAAAILPALLLLLAILRATSTWPSPGSEGTVLIGILVLSLLPIILALLDVIIERGAVVEYAGIKVDFSKTREMGTSGLTVPPNIGVRGQAVTDSSTTEILAALQQAAASDVAVIDLEEGDAWWETRLLVLLSGADRLKRPEKVVFIGVDAGRTQRFQGWSTPSALLRRLVRAHPQYERSLQTARAAARQWELLEPVNPLPPGFLPTTPRPPWLPTPLATRHPWMAFDAATGLRNEFLEEQLLQSDLGEKIEQHEGSIRITLIRLEDLFRPVLNKDAIDLSWPANRQLDAFLQTEASSIAITEDGKYSTLVPRLTLLNQVLKPLLKSSERQ